MEIRELNRKPLRADIHQEIRGRILKSEFRPHDRLKDTSLAAALGTSRTPVREALIRLEREGFLENSVGRGFRVRSLTSTEVREVYPIIWTLESLALRDCEPHNAEEIKKLHELIVAMERSGTDPATRIELDKEWHAILCGKCENTYLKKLIEDLKATTYRYEFAFMEVQEHTKNSTREHREVLSLLKNGDVTKAVKALKGHWQSGMQAILKGIADQEGAVT